MSCQHLRFKTRITINSLQHFLPGMIWSPSYLNLDVIETVLWCGTLKGQSWKCLLCRLRSIAQEWYLQMGCFVCPLPTSPQALLSTDVFYTTTRSIPDAFTLILDSRTVRNQCPFLSINGTPLQQHQVDWDTNSYVISILKYTSQNLTVIFHPTLSLLL